MLRKAFFILLSTAVMVSCTEKEPDNGGGGSSWGTDIPEGNVEVTVLADRQSLLQNPLSGWVIYVPLIDDVARFWNEYENFQSSEGTVNVFDYGNVIYLRGSWTDFNPEEGVYIWQDGVDENKYPLVSKGMWSGIVDLKTHKLLNWKSEYGDLYLQAKVCDSGTYFLLDKDKKSICKIADYVPNGLIPESDDCGDYIRLSINSDGTIENWPENPDYSD